MILKRKNNFSPKFNKKKSHIKKNFQKRELHKSSENIVKGINKDLELISLIFIWTTLCLPKKKILHLKFHTLFYCFKFQTQSKISKRSHEVTKLTQVLIIFLFYHHLFWICCLNKGINGSTEVRVLNYILSKLRWFQTFSNLVLKQMQVVEFSYTGY